ncbi:hypothetical protein ACWDR3_11105 [Streptomyces sp. NPDC001002]
MAQWVESRRGWMLIDFPASDLPEPTRRLHEHVAGRSVPPTPADWSTVGR